LAIARNIGIYGIRVYGLSATPLAPGYGSAFCRRLLCPDSTLDPDGLEKFLLKSADFPRKSIIFPTRDEDILFLDSHRNKLSELFTLAIPDHETLEIILDKSLLARHAERCGIPTPFTYKVESRGDIESLKSKVHYPLVVKPVYAFQWRSTEAKQIIGNSKAVLIGSRKELLAFYEKISKCEPSLLLQEWIEGNDIEHRIVGAYFSRTSQCLASFTAQKLLQYPSPFGLGCHYSIVKDDEAHRLAMQLLRSLRFSGIAEVEFKRDRRSGEYKLIEINPRHWDQHSIGTNAGVNISYVAYQDLCGDTNITEKSQTGFRSDWVSGGAVLRRFLGGLKRGKLELGLLKLLVPKSGRMFSIWWWQDPIPFFRVILRRLHIIQ
jgi:D-aspartate ligase